MKILFAAALAIALPITATAAQNGRVVASSGDSFEVGFKASLSPNDYWCAAGNHVVGQMRMPSNTPIYRLSPAPRLRGQGMTFGLAPQGNDHRPGLAGLVVSRVDVLRAFHARALCNGNTYDFD